MADKATFQSTICRPFCRYFRPDHKEELACRAAQLVDDLLQRGLLRAPELPGNNRKIPSLWLDDAPALGRVVCRPCPFAVDGCDFRENPRSAAVEPCGGYILLRLLLADGRVAIVDLATAEGDDRVA